MVVDLEEQPQQVAPEEVAMGIPLAAVTPVEPSTTNAHDTTRATTTTPPLPLHEQPKQGSKCCGCCCDYRRAVIIVNFVSLLLNIMGMIAYFGSTVVVVEQGYIDSIEGFGRLHGILTSIGIFFSVVAIIGAYRYNAYLVGMSIGWTILYLFLRTILNHTTSQRLQAAFEQEQLDAYGRIVQEYDAPNLVPDIIATIIFIVLLVYPHVGFIYEVRKGILSPETYPREEFSCCCTKR